MTVDRNTYIRSKFPDKSPNSAGEIHCNCPFHDDRTKSFSINVSTGVFVCGSTKCAVRGNFFLFYKMIEKLDSWKEVYEALSTPTLASSIDTLFGENEKKRQTAEVTNLFPPWQFWREIGYLKYLEDRGISKETCDLFGLKCGIGGKFDGVDIAHTILAPIFDLDGTYRTFQARALNDRRLRWNTPIHSPISYLLYGGWFPPPERGSIMIVEGASDVWNLASNGVYSVGLFTSRASKTQLMKIAYLCEMSKSTPVVLLDGDARVFSKKSGKSPVKVLYGELLALGLSPRWFPLEDGEDPGGMSKERICELQEKLKVDHGYREVFE